MDAWHHAEYAGLRRCVDLPGRGAEGINVAESGSGGQAGETAAVRIAELDRLVRPGQDREDHHGGREQRAQPEQDRTAPPPAAA